MMQEKNNFNKNVLQKVVFFLLTILTLYYIYNAAIFVTSILKDLKSLGIEFYEANPLIIVANALESIISTIILIILTINQSKIAFNKKTMGKALPIILSALFVVIMIVSDVIFYNAIKTLYNNNYSVLSFLLSYVSDVGLVHYITFVFSVFYLTNSIFLAKNIAKAKSK